MTYSGLNINIFFLFCIYVLVFVWLKSGFRATTMEAVVVLFFKKHTFPCVYPDEMTNLQLGTQAVSTGPSQPHSKLPLCNTKSIWLENSICILCSSPGMSIIQSSRFHVYTF